MADVSQKVVGILLTLVMVVVYTGTEADKTVLRLAVFLPKSGYWPIGRIIEPAAQMAVDDVNNNSELLADYSITMTTHDSGCNQGMAFLEMINTVMSSQSIQGIIGDGCDAICEPFGLLASAMELPIVSWGCTSIVLSDKRKYKTFARTVGQRHDTIKVIVGLLRHFRWQRIGMIYTSEDAWEWMAQSIKTEFEGEFGGFVRDMHAVDVGRKNMSPEEKFYRINLFKHILLELRIIIICGGPGEVRQLMLGALDHGLLTGEYVFIAMDLTADHLRGKNTWMGDDGRDDDVIKACQGLLNIYMAKPHTDKYRQFEERLADINKKERGIHTLPGEVDVHAGMLYDAVLLYAYAMQKTLDLGHNISDGYHVARFLCGLSMNGITGKVCTNIKGDRLRPPYGVQVFDGVNFKEFAHFSYIDNEIRALPNTTLLFPGGRTDVPKDKPACGWKNEYCENQSVVLPVAVSVPMCALALGTALAAYLIFRRFKNELEGNNEQLWRIKPQELMATKPLGNKNSKISFNRSLGTLTNKSLGEASYQQIFAEVAIFKGISVCLTKMTEENIIVDHRLLLALKQARNLHHENINAFIGACIDPPFRRIVNVYCPRGSLMDVLENYDIKLSDDFKISFALDVCNGMEYLHASLILSHGRLKSSNCVIDNRWVCKVTDYGLEGLRNKNSWESEYLQYHSLLWTAPELLRMSEAPFHGTKAADVYAYGMILQEIALRGQPYCMLVDKDVKAIIEEVRIQMEPPFRPTLSDESCPQSTYSLMTKCWQEAPETRPSFTEVKKMIKDANKHRKLNIMDNMIQMMEQYADHLEDIVTERTQQLQKEKKKTDQLLYQMLPKSVADDLKLGKAAHPEHYSQATLYFSDIVGFTAISSQSTPLQVVKLLSDLYSLFDNIIDRYDAYKVETIGDAYMVVSGVPVTNGIQHAGQVACLALDMLNSVMSFEISHMPETQLKLRIGIHTGPVVAGVVGLKMPRYCLFGDTVNIATRMESNGLPLRIHMSQITQGLLEEVGGYLYEERGAVESEGKYKPTTYWLLGRTTDISRSSKPDLQTVVIPTTASQQTVVIPTTASQQTVVIPNHG